MEGVLSESNKEEMVSSFLEIVVGQTPEIATQFLQATNWKLEEAIQLFYVGNDGGIVASESHSPVVAPLAEISSPSVTESASGLRDLGNEYVGQNVRDEVRPPLPVVRETLYDDAVLYGVGHPQHASSSLIAFRNFREEVKHPGVWESDESATSIADKPRDLASLYRPPFHLMFQGSFEKAKGTASLEDKWLLVNLQSTKEFSSHMLNRDTWANEALAQTVSTNFIFWQVYDDSSEGKKVCTYYKLDSVPVILIIDPITGQKMRSWCGMVQPESLLEDLVPFMDGGPRDHHVTLSHKRQRGSSSIPQKQKVEPHEEDEELQKALVASIGDVKDTSAITSNDKETTSTDKEEESSSTKTLIYPLLPEEPKVDKSLLCRVGVRLPDGRRVQRNFLKTDSIQLLWSFCYSHLGEAGTRPFCLTQGIPGAKSLDYESKLTIGESGLANSMISVAWEGDLIK